MKPGPPPIPFPLKRHPGHWRLHAEPEPEIASNIPEPPSFLSSFALDEWWRVGPELHRLSLLTVTDVMPFAAYCVAYGRWQDAEEMLERIAVNDPVMQGLLIKTVDGEVRINPLVVVSRNAADAMLRAASEFGLTPAARTRIAAGVHGQPGLGKFEGLIGGA